jgi:hypothetical protein
MQTIAVHVQDDFMQSFLEFVNNHQENITITKDKNLELDPYFYDRQKQLQQDLEEVESGKAEMISHNELWSNINKHLQTLKS